MAGYFITDDDCLQCHEYVSEKVCNLIQINEHPNDWRIAFATIDLDEYTVEELSEYARLYGYDDIENIPNTEPDTNWQLVAEMVFETDAFEFEGSDVYQTFKEAAQAIELQTGLDLSEYYQSADEKDDTNRPRLSDQEVVRHMKEAGWTEEEINEELESRAWRDEQMCTAAEAAVLPHTNPLRELTVLSDVCEDHVRSVSVTYGKIPINFDMPEGTDFDPLTVDYEQIILEAHNQQHGKFYDSISLALDKSLNVVYASLEGSSAMPFDRVRRITGYLVGNLDRFNDAKRAEVDDRVKHGTGLADEAKDSPLLRMRKCWRGYVNCLLP